MSSISSCYYIKRQSYQNTISSSSDVITTDTAETTLDTEIWYDYYIDSTVVSTFTEISDVPADTTIATDNPSTSKFESEDSTEGMH